MRAFPRRSGLAMAVILAASLALTACGRKGPPEAPVTTATEAPMAAPANAP